MRAAAPAWHALKRLPRPLLAASAAGWALLAVHDTGLSLPTLCMSAATAAEAFNARMAAALAFAPLSALMPAWLAMMLAMMPPLLASPLRHVWHRSLRRRRRRAAMLFVLGYALIWVAAGSLLFATALVLGSVSADLPSLALAAIIVIAWQGTPFKQISLNRCHGRPPLAAFGFRAEVDALRFGAGHGAWCVGSCWALMLLPLAADGLLHWILMAGVMLIAAVERTGAPRVARWGAAWPDLSPHWHATPASATAFRRQC
jgi:predicted metal-binding membrane protein